MQVDGSLFGRMSPSGPKVRYRHGSMLSRRSFLRAMPQALLLARQAKSFAQGSTGVHFSVLEFDRARIIASATAELARPALFLANVPPPPGAPASESRTLHSSQLNAFGAVEKDKEHESDAPFFKQISLLVSMVARVAALTAAWRLTHEQRFYDVAWKQVQVWCVDTATRMSPTLEQAGTLGAPADDDRVNGVCQTVCLAELARACSFLCSAPATPTGADTAVRNWFAVLLTWMNESGRGMIAREAKDLQAICWTMQAAEFARITRNDTIYRECTHRFRDKLLRQMNLDGYFPPALQTKRPYAASMFTLECLGSACESLSTSFESQWNYTLPDGRGMRAAVAWASPYLANKGKWPYVSDAHLFGEQPLRCNALLLSGRAWNRQDYVDLWKQLHPDTTNVELLREHPITQPGLWAMRPPA